MRFRLGFKLRLFVTKTRQNSRQDCFWLIIRRYEGRFFFTDKVQLDDVQKSRARPGSNWGPADNPAISAVSRSATELRTQPTSEQVNPTWLR